MPYRSAGWGGLLAPRGPPAAVTAKLMDKLAAIMALPAVQQQIQGTGAEPGLLLGAEFGKFMREDYERVGVAAKAAKLQAE